MIKFDSVKLAIIKKDVYSLLHVIILILSLFLIISISYDTFTNVPFQQESSYLKIQLWICLFFLFDFFLELIFTQHKLAYLKSHFIFFFISIPYLSIIDAYHIELSNEAAYFIRFIPLVRGGYALAIIVGRFTKSKVTSLFVSYLTMLLATVYFASLLFFVMEHNVNPAVVNYTDSLWWAFMNVTTVGSNIYAVTAVGRILSVILPSLGMMMFPIFTVYMTNEVQRVNKKTPKTPQNQ
ncbi:potassium channel family protein [Flavobacterium agricola]|uniref:Potassium channel family protein n=1 Tax=Flavobacterium agricola TaxID=2870839 RepID=A0ABY6LW99_9FLAO|nr:potassium channel family protein [Flavobacterium agricola]UYW00464.1 potassium channel family protein [Flavobacterium agricola]